MVLLEGELDQMIFDNSELDEDLELFDLLLKAHIDSFRSRVEVLLGQVNRFQLLLVLSALLVVIKVLGERALVLHYHL